MKNACLFLTLLFLGLSVSAQRDTSRLDIGWLTLDRDLTQTITVKGADLQKMPFVNLSDAIRAWFFGAYTVPGTLAYVVDGNPMTDVNLYPVYEIEEVTLVLNATGAAAYGSSQQNVVIVTTKRGKEKQGFRVAGQAGLVNMNGNGLKTYTNVYHQYYISGYQRLDKVSYGFSADWVRDVLPAHSEPGDHVSTPFNLQRWRLNGFLRWEPAKGQHIELGVGYMPQRIDGELDSGVHITERMRGHLLAPQLNWRGELLPGLRQELRVGYLGSSTDYSLLSDDGINHGGELAENRVSQLFAHERLSYAVTAGDWSLRPAVNLFYDHIDEKSAVGYATFGVTQTGGILLPPVLPPLQEQKGDLLFLTPSVELGWRQAVNLQVGAQANLHGGGSDTAYAKLLPFATLGVDVLGFGKTPGRMSLKVFGSYAQRTQEFVDDYSLIDLSGGGGAYSLGDRPAYTHDFLATGGGGVIDTLINQYVPTHYPNRFNLYQTGISFAMGTVFRISYSYERREFLVPGIIFGAVPVTGGPGVALTPLYKSDLHHVDVRVRVGGDNGLVWETGLGATALRSRQYYDIGTLLRTGGSFFTMYTNYNLTGDFYPAKLSWTGGFVNRLRVGGLEAGLDILYHFGETAYGYNSYGAYTTGHLNSVMVPNIFVGYNWKLRHGQSLGLFVESRGLVRSKSSDLPDNRRYYTVGGSWGL